MKSNESCLRLGDAVRKRRLELGLSQEAFADSIGMHRAYYGRIERGGVSVTLPSLVRLAEGLGLNCSELLKNAEL